MVKNCKKKLTGKPRSWLFPIIVIILVVLYGWVCCWRCRIFLIEIIVSLLLTALLFLKKRKKEEEPGPTLPPSG